MNISQAHEQPPANRNANPGLTNNGWHRNLDAAVA
jgi:hypothetical protein